MLILTGFKTTGMDTTFARRVNDFNRQLKLDILPPENVDILNPFVNADTLEHAAAFYNKYYNDNNKRKLVLGINPGRLGAGTTGVPFTDPKRLAERCGIPFDGRRSHEPSSAFIYEMIDAYGGIEIFYSRYYISSVCPLGFIKTDAEGNKKNYNYFDSKALKNSLESFITWNIEAQIKIGCATEICYCLGLSKNYQYLLELNNRKGYFDRIIPLEHPRYIMQYKAKEKAKYINDYLQKLQ
jgi:hypothetical protein